VRPLGGKIFGWYRLIISVGWWCSPKGGSAYVATGKRRTQPRSSTKKRRIRPTVGRKRAKFRAISGCERFQTPSNFDHEYSPNSSHALSFIANFPASVSVKKF